jgi:hypothetical protein
MVGRGDAERFEGFAWRRAAESAQVLDYCAPH